MNAPLHDVTRWLQAWTAGDPDAAQRVMTVVYAELRRRAAAHLRRERPGCTLQPTALVHEVYIRLVDQQAAHWNCRAQFLAVASQMMRRVLVDRARAHHAVKRGLGWTRVSLEDASDLPAASDGIDVLALDDALERLARIDPRKSQIAELRFFGGLSLEETGQALHVSARTVERDWQLARAWLFRALASDRVHASP